MLKLQSGRGFLKEIMSNQIININLDCSHRTILHHWLNRQIETLGLGRNITDLDLAIKLDKDYPLNGEEIDLSTLVVLAHKLKMKIIIRDIELTPC